MANETAPEVGHSLDDVVIGLSYILFSLIFAIIYIPCLIVMRTDPELKQHSCLRVMFHLGLSDILQLLGQVMMGMWSLTGYAFTISRWLNNFLVNLTSVYAWNAYLPLANLLAFNRAVALTSDQLQQKLFGPTATTMWLAACWIYSALWFAFNMSPWGGMIYYGAIWGYYFDFGAPLFKEYKLAALLNCIFHQVCMWIFNAISLFGLKKQIGQMVTVNQEARKKEQALLIQALIICLVLLLMDQYWHNVVIILCPAIGPYCYPIGNQLVIINSAVNPVLYLIFNKTIRKKVFEMIGKKAPGVVSKLSRATSRRPSQTAATSKKNNSDMGSKRVEAWPDKSDSKL